jgi:hypothetical protein
VSYPQLYWATTQLGSSTNSRWNAASFIATCPVGSVNGFAIRRVLKPHMLFTRRCNGLYSEVWTPCNTRVSCLDCTTNNEREMCEYQQNISWYNDWQYDRKILSIYQQMRFTLQERSCCQRYILSKLHTCRMSHLTRTLLTYPLHTSCDWQLRFWSTQTQICLSYLVSTYTNFVPFLKTLTFPDCHSCQHQNLSLYIGTALGYKPDHSAAGLCCARILHHGTRKQNKLRSF